METAYNQLITTESTPLINLISTYGISDIRDVSSITGAAAATLDNGEIRISTTANGNDRYILSSARNGIYLVGSQSECGIGLRVPMQPAGNQYIEWGISNNSDGFLFGLDGTGWYIKILKGGVSTIIRENEWLGAKLSSLTSFPTNGIVFRPEFTYYGYGAVSFKAYITTESGIADYLLHTYRPVNSNSIVDPNLPIRVEINNNGQATDRSVFVGGRQFMAHGKFEPLIRQTPEFRGSVTTNTSTFRPLIAVRKKATFKGRDNTVTVYPLSASGSAVNHTHVFAVYLDSNSTVTGGSWVNPTGTPAAETAIETNITGTTYTPSNNSKAIAYFNCAANDTLTTSDTNTNLQPPFGQPLAIPNGKALILCARSVSSGLLSTPSISVSTLTVGESW